MEQAKLAKRFYGEREAARGILPWDGSEGKTEEDWELQRGFERPVVKSIFDAPFGTDADLRHGRPEDAGTADYLPHHQIKADFARRY